VSAAARTAPRPVPFLGAGAWRLSAARAEAGVWPRTKRPLPWLLAAFLAMVWLVPFDSVSLPITLPLDAKLDRPLLIVIAAAWVLSLATFGSVSRLRVSPVHWAVLALLLVATTSLVLNAQTLILLGDLEGGIRKLALLYSYALLFVIVASAVRPEEVRNMVVLMIVLSCITATAALIEYRTGFNAFFSSVETLLPTTRPGELGAVDSIGRKSIVGPTVHPLAIAMMMSLTLPYALLALHDSHEWRPRILNGLAAALMIAAAVATQRKTSFIAPLVGLGVLSAYRPRTVPQLIPLGLVMIALVHVGAPGALGSVGEQLKPQNLFGVMSTKDRQSDYGAIKPDVIQHPILGRGYESYDQKKYRILDNQYLTLVIGAGGLGVLTYLGVFATILLLAHRVARDGPRRLRAPAVASAAAIAALVAGSALLDTLALPQLAYLICFIGGLTVVMSQAEA
jgi:hypothetical protein